MSVCITMATAQKSVNREVFIIIIIIAMYGLRTRSHQRTCVCMYVYTVVGSSRSSDTWELLPVLVLFVTLLDPILSQ